MTKDDIVQQLKIYIPFTSETEVEQCAEDILQQHNKEMQRLLQQTTVNHSSGDTIEDGFGGVWSKRCLMCGRNGMQVMRPGKVQCRYCG